MHHASLRSRRRWTAVLAAALLAAPVVGSASPGFAADSTVASGSNFTVEQTAGGYAVTLDLDDPLPVKSDAPTIIVDGTEIGIATESKDGSTLTVVTSDPDVASAKKVSAGWASRTDAAESGSGEAAAKSLAPALLADEDPAEPLDENPASTGSYEYTESVYNFGAQSVALSAIGGVRGELEGKVYLPKTGGERPVVILLHGRHSTCYAEGSSSASLAWPCTGSRPLSIPSYLGYDGTGRALASHGYAVLSISANAINANDNTLALDQGAQARGQLVLDTLEMLKKANAGDEVSYRDAQTQSDVTLASALTGGLTPQDLEGRFDLSNVGLMGHSRGGEGVTSAATLNNALDTPFGIKAVLPLAPVDFGRMTVPNIPMDVILPYCDGDVSNQQGQHMLDDSRYAYGDDALRTATWVMGANHNFFNTVWTPGKFPAGTADDWGSTSNNQTCGPIPSVADTSIRLSADAQYDVGTAYMAGYFRLTLGHEKQFLPMFDGSGSRPEVIGSADVRTVATAPSSTRSTITSFEKTSSLVRNYGTATAAPCASLAGRTIPTALATCSTLASSQVPHWTPASNGGNVPATPVTRMVWTGAGGEVRVTVPSAQRDATAYSRLSVKVAADDTVATGTDLTLSVRDGSGKVYSSLVSALNPYALVRLPAPTNATTTTLKKVVLQQVNVPVSALTDAGLDAKDIREVRFTSATGADGTANGAAYLSDLAWESSSIGTPVVATENTVNVFTSTVEEGNAPGTADVAVYLSEPAESKVTAYTSILGSTTGRGGIAMEKVTFAPGEQCKVVSGSLLGDALASSTASTAVKVSVINTSGAVMGAKAFGNLVVREDDGTTGSAAPLPAVGAQGDACAELQGSLDEGTVAISDETPAPGGSTTLTATGHRSGESVRFSLGSVVLGTAVADVQGTATLVATVPADTAIGEATVTAVGLGFGHTSKGSLEVLTETSTTLSIDPELPAINQPVTLSAAVTDGEGGTVTFKDGDVDLGTGTVTDGTATLTVDGFKAGSHELTAGLGQTATFQSSVSAPVSFTLVKGKSTIALALGEASKIFGSSVSGAVAVAGADHGTVTLTYGGASKVVEVDGSGVATFSLPATLGVGSYDLSATFDGTDEVDPSGTATASFTVVKKATSVAGSSPASSKLGRSFTVTSTVSTGVSGYTATGQVKVYVKSPGAKAYKLARTATLTSGSKGKSTFTMKPVRKGTFSYRIEYVGSANLKGSTSAVKTVKIS